MPEETTYYSDTSGIRVTNKRVIVRNVTYSTANIASVATAVEAPDLTGPLVFMVVGVLLLALALQWPFLCIFALPMLAIAYFWWRGCKPLWHLRISSTSGDSTPLKSINQKWIQAIAQAINEAMVDRA